MQHELIRKTERSYLKVVRATTAPLLVVMLIMGGLRTCSGAERSASLPCQGSVPEPMYAALGATPNVQIWKGSTLPPIFGRAECSGWGMVNYRTLIAIAGTGSSVDEFDTVLSRFGEVSRLLAVRYWSTTDQTWRPLVLAATAWTREAEGRSRADFTTAELKSGQDLYMSQRDSRGASEVTYRMRLRASTPTRFVIETENVTDVRIWGLTLFKPGDLRALYFVEHPRRGIWTYYVLTGIRNGSWLVAGHEKSYVNRAVALYRHFSGIPTDLEPPAAR